MLINILIGVSVGVSIAISIAGAMAFAAFHNTIMEIMVQDREASGHD